MTSTDREMNLLPRPVERLPEYAHGKARTTLAEKLVSAFGLSQSAAGAIANAVVDPSEVRKLIGTTEDPAVEYISVPNGKLLGIRTEVWARRVMPDPRNPRIGPSRKHPFAVEPGTGGEDAKFRPIPEPRSPDGASPGVGEMVVNIDSRHHLNWGCQQAAAYVIAENNWIDSIKYHGVMEAVWLVPTTFIHADGSDPATTLVSAEGSSRLTAEHSILGVRSSDVPYEESESKFRGYLRKLNDSFEHGPKPEDIVALRCERVPALILVKFVPHGEGDGGFPTAVKSLVALRHVDPPKPWGDGPENESLADEVLDEFHRRSLISPTERDYLAGACTRAEARAAHLSDDPAVRAARILRVFTEKDGRFEEALRAAVTSQSTRRRITPKLRSDLATALILRATDESADRIDQIRRYMRHAFAPSVHTRRWESTDRDIDHLTSAALSEVRNSIAQESEEPGPATLELAVRGAYALVVSGRLNADRGTANNDQPDRRTPGQVLEAMRGSAQGVLQIGRAVKDFIEGAAIRAVDEGGAVRRLSDGSGDVMVNDVFLRGEYPVPGSRQAPRPGDTPLDRYQNGVGEVTTAIGALKAAFDNLVAVTGDDGRPLVETRGVDKRVCDPWRDTLDEIRDELVVWSRAFKKSAGAVGAAKASQAFGGDEGVDVDARENDAVAEWEAEADASAT